MIYKFFESIAFIEKNACLRVRYRVEISKIKFISISGHVTFCLLYKHTNNDAFVEFPKISDHFPKVPEDFPKLFRRLDERLRSFFEHFPKITEEV